MNAVTFRERGTFPRSTLHCPFEILVTVGKHAATHSACLGSMQMKPPLRRVAAITCGWLVSDLWLVRCVRDMPLADYVTQPSQEPSPCVHVANDITPRSHAPAAAPYDCGARRTAARPPSPLLPAPP